MNESGAKTTEVAGADFALGLYREVAKSRFPEGNIVFSALSVGEALGMAALGAQGETFRQLKKVLPEFKTPLSPEDEHGFELTTANRVWMEKSSPPLASYLESARKYFGAEPEALDFKDSPEPSRLRINRWVAEKTRENIRDLLPENSITEATRIVLTNAIYFKAKWQMKFKKEATSDEDFHLSARKKIQTPFMHQTNEFAYSKERAFSILELPYLAGQMVMDILLPNKEDGLPSLETSLTGSRLQEALGRLKNQRVAVALPKFRIEDTHNELVECLKHLGAIDAFVYGKADFSGISGDRELFISRIIQKAMTQVDEEGTEAAAATAVFGLAGAAFRKEKPVIFRADHPFLFVIRAVTCGEIYFMGRLAAPNAK
jgi:serpin B